MLNQTSFLNFIPERSGMVSCAVNNSEGSNEIKVNVTMSDLEEEFFIWTNSELPISTGDNVSVRCGALTYRYAAGLNWYKNGNIIVNSPGKSLHFIKRKN